jgi:xylan 1,4-beta-xylosidase
MKINRFSLGQTGDSSEPMFADRTAEIRTLRPRVIRVFVQEYFDLLPEPRKYHFATLDASVDAFSRQARRRCSHPS